MTSGQILIVDDHEIVRRGIRSLLSSHPDWKICGEAADGLEAVAKARALRPAVVLMDISTPRMDGLEAARIIRKELPFSITKYTKESEELVQQLSQEIRTMS